ncbi:MAG: STAS domain-containing protein [Lachnospiraceae bacterium]|nr:STAS domain-containing protein [Lachnospiraceae bacterium]
MTVNEIRTEQSIQLDVEGKVDTVTAPELQNAILKAFQKSSNVILNINEVSYMSSAGLRALLLGQKTAQSKGGSFKVVNVQDTVMQVLNMSGFAKILNIS